MSSDADGANDLTLVMAAFPRIAPEMQLLDKRLVRRGQADAGRADGGDLHAVELVAGAVVPAVNSGGALGAVQRNAGQVIGPTDIAQIGARILHRDGIADLEGVANGGVVYDRVHVIGEGGGRPRLGVMGDLHRAVDAALVRREFKAG